MSDEEQEYKEISLKKIGKAFGYFIAIIMLFIFYEGMAIEFIYFDEFTIFIVLLFIYFELSKLVTFFQQGEQIQEEE